MTPQSAPCLPGQIFFFQEISTRVLPAGDAAGKALEILPPKHRRRRRVAQEEEDSLLPLSLLLLLLPSFLFRACGNDHPFCYSPLLLLLSSIAQSGTNCLRPLLRRWDRRGLRWRRRGALLRASVCGVIGWCGMACERERGRPTEHTPPPPHSRATCTKEEEEERPSHPSSSSSSSSPVRKHSAVLLLLLPTEGRPTAAHRPDEKGEGEGGNMGIKDVCLPPPPPYAFWMVGGALCLRACIAAFRPTTFTFCCR